MVRQNSIAPAPGSKKNRKRVGRGNGSGHGTYSAAVKDKSPAPDTRCGQDSKAASFH